MPATTRSQTSSAGTTASATLEDDFEDAIEDEAATLPQIIDDQTETPDTMAQVVVQMPQEPPRYDGRNQSKALQWLKEFDATAAFNNHDDKRKLAGVRFVLKEVAADWYDANEPFADWSKFATDFKTRFAGQTLAHDEALKQLRKLYQKPKTPTLEHLETTLKWCRDLNPVPTEKDRVQWFLRTANLRYRAALIAIAPESIDALREKLSTFDALMIHGNEPPLDDPDEYEDSFFGIRSVRKSPLQWNYDYRYDNEPQLHRDGTPYTPGRQRSRSPTRLAPSPSRPSRSPPRQPTPTPNVQPDGPYLKGNRFAPNGSILCNWCGHIGHQIDDCMNRRSGMEARRNPSIPLTRAQRVGAPIARSPSRTDRSPNRRDTSPSRAPSRQPLTNIRPSNIVNQPQQQIAQPHPGNANGRWFNK